MAAGRGLLFELRSWARHLLPSRYVAVYYPTAPHIARRMLQVAGVTSKDFVVDLVGATIARLLGGCTASNGPPGLHLPPCSAARPPAPAPSRCPGVRGWAHRGHGRRLAWRPGPGRGAGPGAGGRGTRKRGRRGRGAPGGHCGRWGRHPALQTHVGPLPPPLACCLPTTVMPPSMIKGPGGALVPACRRRRSRGRLPRHRDCPVHVGQG